MSDQKFCCLDIATKLAPAFLAPLQLTPDPRVFTLRRDLLMTAFVPFIHLPSENDVDDAKSYCFAMKMPRWSSLYTVAERYLEIKHLNEKDGALSFGCLFLTAKSLTKGRCKSICYARNSLKFCTSFYCHGKRFIISFILLATITSQ